MKMINEYKNKNVLVIGLGKSGVSSAKLLHKLGANVIVNDRIKNPNEVEVNDLTKLGISVVTGSHPLSLLDNIDLVVKNPVVSYDNPLILSALKHHISVITEPELAYKVSDSSLIGVTGTNGKTTTTTMITDIINNSKHFGRAYLAGNIGIPATNVIQKANCHDVIVMELSSFQLMGIVDLHPHISVITNLYDAHIDWHKTRSDYINAKLRITMNQNSKDYLVINWDKEEWRKLSNLSKAQIIPFSRKKININGSYQDGDFLYFKNEKIININDMKLLGNHNIENALAAIAVSKLMNIDNNVIRESLIEFTGIRHRMQYITSINDRKFFNDSKSTNIESLIKALSGFKKNVILLAGGLDRGNNFDGLISSLREHVKAMIVFGETSSKLESIGKKSLIKKIIKSQNVVTAVPIAYSLSHPGDVILFSPACASWDQWPNFEVRGDAFINSVNKLRRELN